MKERKGGEEVGGRGGRWGGDYFFLLQISSVGVDPTLLYTTALPQLPTIIYTYDSLSRNNNTHQVCQILQVSR